MVDIVIDDLIAASLPLSDAQLVVLRQGIVDRKATRGDLRATDAETKTAYEANADTNAFDDAAQTKLAGVSGTNTGDEVAASTTVAGVAELAIVAEVDTGTDNVRTITSLALAGSALQTKVDGVETLADVTDATNVAAAGAVMDSDISAGEGMLRKTGAGAYEAIKTNLSAVTDPGTGDDNTAGYAISSRWTNVTLDKVWEAVDVSTGAAVWKDLSAVGGGGNTIATEDEGSSVDTAATTLNFVGTGVTATDAGSGVTNITVSGGAAPIDSVFTRTGAVVAANGDYTASEVTNVPAGTLAAITVQAALDELDSEKLSITGRVIGTDIQAWAAALDTVSGTNTGDEVAASPTASGIVELATIAEVDTGTDTVRAITPAGLAGSALQTKVDAISGTNTGDEPDASATVKGIVELATIAEVDTGTDTVRAITPAGLAGSALQTTADGAVQPDAATEYSAGQNFNQSALTWGATPAWDASAKQVANLTVTTGSATMASPTNLQAGMYINVTVTQHATTPQTLAWNAIFKKAGGGAIPALTAVASAKDDFTFKYDGTDAILVGHHADIKA